jgi:hypothetical protein
MYYCRWCGIQAGWPTNYAFIHLNECCLCGKKNKCTSVPYFKIRKEVKKISIDLPHEDLIKELEKVLSGF